jgi:hypothetical protein
MGQFLGPETDTVSGPNSFSRILPNRKRKKQFEQTLDYVLVQ